MESATASSSTGESTYDEFWTGLDEFVRALRQARGRSAANTPAGELTMSQYKLLEAVVGRSAPRIGEIAASLDIAAPTATRMLAGLESDGLIERSPAPGDRRAVEVTLTDAGRAARLKARRRLEAKRRRLFESLPEEDREQAARLLRGLAAGMDAL